MGNEKHNPTFSRKPLYAAIVGGLMVMGSASLVQAEGAANPTASQQPLRIGDYSLLLHKLRTFLAMLGIMIGITAVIWLVAGGEGVSYQAQKQLADLGATNIIIRSVKPAAGGTSGGFQFLEYGAAQVTEQAVADIGIKRCQQQEHHRTQHRDVLDDVAECEAAEDFPELHGRFNLPAQARGDNPPRAR